DRGQHGARVQRDAGCGAGRLAEVDRQPQQVGWHAGLVAWEGEGIVAARHAQQPHRCDPWRCVVRKRVSMRAALGDATLLADALPGDSWANWRTLLIALMGEPLTEAERASYKSLTGGREVEPGAVVDTFLAVAGRRSGKSRSMAVLAVYLSTLVDWSSELSIGERGVALFLAPSERQARTVYRYADAIISKTPLLAGLIQNKTQEVVSLSTGVDLEIMAANWRRARGGTAVCVVLDECAFLHSAEDSG